MYGQGQKKETAIERHTKKYAESLGWLCYKFKTPGQRGVPDRIFIRNGMIIFVEFKREGKTPTDLQKEVIGQLIEHGCRVFVIDSKDNGELLFNTIDEQVLKYTQEAQNQAQGDLNADSLIILPG